MPAGLPSGVFERRCLVVIDAADLPAHDPAENIIDAVEDLRS